MKEIPTAGRMKSISKEKSWLEEKTVDGCERKNIVQRKS